MNNQTGQMDNLDITPEQHQELKQLLQQHLPNTKVWAYGSRVTFKARPASDLDLVVFATKEQDRAVWSLRDALEESDLPFSVDVLVWDAIPEHFKPNIQQAYYQVQEYNSEVSGNIVLVPKDWSTRLLSDLVIENGGVQTGPFGSQLHQRDYVEIGTPIITVEHLGENRIRHKNLPCVSDADRDRLSKYSLSVGDIVFSRVGAVDRLSIVKQPEDGWLFSGRCLRVRASPDKIEPMYLAYFLGTPKVKQYIRSIAVGATMPSINTKILSELPISFPPCLKTQKAIAHVLGTLDNKIELNQKMNRVLEDIAKALFKSWFIDFDPIRAKAEGRPTGLPPEISDLFPDELVESKVGEIPMGWEAGKIEDLCDYISSGGTPARRNSKFWNGGDIDWFKTGELKDGPLLGAKEKVTIEGIQSSSAKLWLRHTILFAIYASPTVGRLGYLTQPGSSNQAAAGLVAEKSIGFPFLYWTLFYSRSELQNIAVGAAQQNINMGILKSHKVLIPPKPMMSIFSEFGLAVEGKRELLHKENDALGRLRDTLLPKLISGELRIPDAENFLEQAGI